MLTPKAQLIKLELEKILKQTLSLMDINTNPINLSQTNKIFRLGLQSHISIGLLSKLNFLLTKFAPNLKIQHTQISNLLDLTPKELNKFDFIIGVFKKVPDYLCSELYSKDKLICLSGINKLTYHKKITVKDINTNEHVLVSYYNDYNRSLTEGGIKIKWYRKKTQISSKRCIFSCKNCRFRIIITYFD